MAGTPDSGKAARIARTAFRLFLEQGYEATGIRQICRDAGTEPTTLYYHFSSKKGLFLRLADSFRDTFVSGLPQGVRTGFALEQLRDFFLFSVHCAVSHREQARFYLRFSLFPPRELREEIAGLRESIQRGKDERILPCLADCTARGIIALPLQQARTAYWQFINDNTFNVIFSGWTPGDGELLRLWQAFLRCRLSGDPEGAMGASE